jgi:GDPmannose 4,6-dehydratase
VEELVAQPGKAQKELGWDPKIGFTDLVKIMVDSDMRASGLSPIGEGDKILGTRFPGKWWGVD